MPTVTNPFRSPGLIGIIILIGALLRIWHFVGARSFWMDETMVALDIMYLSPTGLMGALPFEQIAPLGWLLLEKACTHLWDNFEFALRLPSLVGGIAALLIFHRLLKSCVGAWETVAGMAMLSLFPLFIQYSSEVKPYILDAMFSAAILNVSVLLLRAHDQRIRWTLFYGATGIVCIPLSFGGTLAMAGTGTALFAAAAARKERVWALGLVGVGILWASLFVALYQLSYAHNAATITNMTDVYWTKNFAPFPTSLQGIYWYTSTAAVTIGYLLSSSNAQLAAILWLYGMVRIGTREPWIAVLLISTIFATLIASMFGAYPFSKRLILGLAPAVIIGVSSGAIGVVMQFRHRAIATIVMIALLGLSPIKQTAAGASHVPPFPNEEIKPNLAYLERHYRPGDALFLHSRAEAAFFLYGGRFGLSELPYKVTTSFSLDPSCVYDDARTIRAEPRAWLLIYHAVKPDWAPLKSLAWLLAQSGTLKRVSDQPGSSLYLYTAGDRPDAVTLPTSAAICATPHIGSDFLQQISAGARAARREGDAPAAVGK